MLRRRPSSPGAIAVGCSQLCVFTALCKHSRLPGLLKLVAGCNSAFVMAVCSMHREWPRQAAGAIWDLPFGAIQFCLHWDLCDLTQRGPDRCHPVASRFTFQFPMCSVALWMSVMLQKLGRWWLPTREVSVVYQRHLLQQSRSTFPSASLVAASADTLQNTVRGSPAQVDVFRECCKHDVSLSW